MARRRKNLLTLGEEIVGDLEKLRGIEGFGHRFDQYVLKGAGQA